MKNYKKVKEKCSPINSFLIAINKIYYHKGELSKFYIVGGIGLVINYLVSYFIFTSFHLDHIQSSIFGIIVSLSSNFMLNKLWTFRDRTMKYDILLRQYLKYFFFNSVGVIIQISIVYGFGKTSIDYGAVIIFAISIASILNYIVNKKFIFKNRKEIVDIRNRFWN
ncbi:MAG TPA: GtrA family protein [Nitrososphaeraceae archaeon]